MAEEFVELIGEIKYVLFTSDNGYRVLVVKPENENMKKIHVCGTDLPDRLMLSYKFTGTFKRHPKYGECFNAITATPVCPDDQDGMIEYLASGIFKGIGPSTAAKIVNHFKEQTKTILETTPDRLREVKGISEKRIASIIENMRDSSYIREVYATLEKYGLKIDHCSKLVKKYKNQTLSKITENPYRLIKDISIGFSFADQIALEMGIEADSKIRLAAACDHVMTAVLMNGDTGCELQSFGSAVDRLLKNSVNNIEVENYIIDAIKDHTYRSVKLTIDNEQKRYIFLSTVFDQEKTIAARLVALSKEEMRYPIKNLSAQIRKYEETNEIEFDEIQTQAIKEALTHSLTIITGGPGTGKTTIEKAIITLFKNNTGKNAILLAPTGRAARRMTEATGHNAYTIHSFLGIYDTESAEEEVTENEQTHNSLIVIDEMSMTDVKIMKLLLERIGHGNTVVLIGDPDQLPSVGAGAVLRDILDVTPETITKIKLERAYRSNNNTIYDNIYKINNGITANLKADSSCCFIKATNKEETVNTIAEHYVNAVKKYGLSNVMLLLPYRKNEVGVDEINRKLQNIINPHDERKGELVLRERIFRTGDLVMHIKCNTDTASNGDIGIIKAIEKDGSEYSVLVSINDKLVTYTRDDIDCLDLAYAMTVHKSQGSEAKCVIFVITSDHQAMLYRNIPYVAMSRAREELQIICDNSFVKAVRTYKRNTRLTLLPYFLKVESGQFVA